MFQYNINSLSGVPFHLDEQELIKHLYVLNEIQRWIDGVSGDLLRAISIPRKRESNEDNIYLTVAGLCDILTVHYHKIQKQNRIPRFTIPVVDILIFLQEAAAEPVSTLAVTGHFQTLVNTGKMIGYDRNNFPTCFFTIISEVSGRIITAYPGFCENEEDLFQ